MDLDGFQGSFRKLWGYVNSVRLGAEHMAEDGCITLVSRGVRTSRRRRDRSATDQRGVTRLH
jgi:hypothetical protein